jgi:hypothetical protein
MTKCSITRCGNDAVIKGLCRKHYMRLRRNGDATVTKTPGPKPRADPHDELARKMVRDRSPRTLARCRRAWTLSHAIGPKFIQEYLAASKIDGAVNVSKLLRLAEDEVLRQIHEVQQLGNGTVQNLLDNPDYRQFRASPLSVCLKSIRAWRKRNEE